MKKNSRQSGRVVEKPHIELPVYLYSNYYQTTKICVKHAIKVECYHEVKWLRYCIYQSYHANCRHTACCRNYCTRKGDWNHGRHFQIRSCEKTIQHNAIQLYCLCVEKFTFWFVNYIKQSIHFFIKHQQFNNTRR